MRQVVLPKEGVDETMKTLFELGVNQTFSLQKCSSEPAVYVSTMRQCFASEYFFEASKKHTCVICEHGQTPFEERDNLNISLPGVEAKIYHHLLETFFASSSHYICKCKI